MSDGNNLGICSSLCDCVCSVTADGKCDALRELRAENEVLQSRIEKMQRAMVACMYNKRMSMWSAFLHDHPDAAQWVNDEYAALRGEGE